MNPPGHTPRVLVVEDNEDDVVLLRLAFQRVGVPVHLDVAANGAEGLRCLRAEGADRPDLVLLDINMPVMDGRELLATLDADAVLRCIPVVVMTTSAREEDVRRMYRLRCAGYVVKPVDVAAFFEMVRTLCAYWFTVVRLPSRPS